MAHHRPGLAAVPGLVEADQVVVALGADEPLARADHVLRVQRIDPDVGFGMVGHEHGRRRRVGRPAADLGRIWPRGAGVFAGVGAGARQLARVAVVRAVVERNGHFRPVAADLLARDEDVGDVVRREARVVGTIGLHALRDVADAGACARWRRGGKAGRQAKAERDQGCGKHGDQGSGRLHQLQPPQLTSRQHHVDDHADALIPTTPRGTARGSSAPEEAIVVVGVSWWRRVGTGCR